MLTSVAQRISSCLPFCQLTLSVPINSDHGGLLSVEDVRMCQVQRTTSSLHLSHDRVKTFGDRAYGQVRNLIHINIMVTWITALDCSPSRRTWRINLSRNCKRYNESETTYQKLLAKYFRSAGYSFGSFMCDLFFRTNFPNNVQTKSYQTDLESPRCIL